MLHPLRLTAASALLVLSLGLSACGGGDSTSGSAEDAVWPHEASDVAVDDAVRWGVLENGLRYAIMKNETPKNALSLRLFVGAGSMHEDDDQQGVAHFLEHMAFKGSENMPGEEVVKFLERLGLAFGPDTNAYTSFAETVYMLELPEADSETVTTGVEIFRDFAGRLLLEEEAIDKERGVIMSEMRFRNSPGYRQVKALYGFLAPDSLFVQRFPIGTKEVIESAPREAFTRFYEDYYRPENMMVVAVGEIEPAEIEELIKAQFADFIREGEAGADYEEVPFEPRELAAGYFFDPDIPTQVQIYGIGAPTDLPDTKETRRKAVVEALGNAILSRRFQILSREDDATFLGGSAGYFSMEELGNFSVISLTTSPQQWKAAMGTAEQELRRALEHGFESAELDEQLANTETSMVNAVEAARTRESSALAGGLVAVASDDVVFSTPQTNLDLFREIREDLTLEEVNEAFRKTWADLEPQLFLSGNLQMDDPEAEILAAYNESKAVETPRRELKAAAAFAYTDFGEAGEVVSREEIEDLGIITVKFDNNVLLNMKVTDFEDDTIYVNARMGGGLLTAPADKPGLSFLADYAFTSGGLDAHSYDDIIRIFAGKTVDVSFSVDADAFVLSGATDPKDLSSQLNLMTAYVLAPGYRDSALSRLRKGLDIVYETIDATPGGIVQRDVARIIRSGDPRFGLPPKEQVLERDLDELKDWITQPLRLGHMEIAVVGDFDPEEMIAQVARTFGALPKRAFERGDFSDGATLTFPNLTDTQTLRHGGEADRAMSQIYWPTTDGRDRDVARRLSVLSRVMDLRLTEHVRREEGATYSPSVGTNMGTVFPDYGYIVTGLDLKPSDTDRFMKDMLDLGVTLRDEGFTDDEFQRAIKPVLEAVEENLERNGYWLYNVVSQAQTQPEDLEAARTYKDSYEAITREEVEALAKDYLDPEKTARFIILPPEGKSGE